MAWTIPAIPPPTIPKAGVLFEEGVSCLSGGNMAVEASSKSADMRGPAECSDRRRRSLHLCIPSGPATTLGSCKDVRVSRHHMAVKGGHLGELAEVSFSCQLQRVVFSARACSWISAAHAVCACDSDGLVMGDWAGVYITSTPASPQRARQWSERLWKTHRSRESCLMVHAVSR